MNAPDKPALLGGARLNPNPLPSYNTIGEEEKKAVMEVLDSGQLSGFVASPGEHFFGGPWVRRIEREFCERFGTRYAVAVNSATSGLYCMLMATGIGPGDEVIVPPYTMHATASMVLQTGAIPIFADIEPETFGLDPASVASRIGPHTRGVLAVNLFGHPARLDELASLAGRHGLFLLEDNAQAPGAMCNGRFAATIGKAGVFSFNRHKTIQCGEGGVVVTDDPDMALKMRLVRNHGEAVVEAMGVEDIVNTMGQNLRMTEMEAAVAVCQLAKLEELNGYRCRLAERLTRGLDSIPGITPPGVRQDASHVYYFYVMRYDERATGLSRKRLVEAINAEGFYLREGYLRPIYMEPLFQRKICFGPHGFPFSAHPTGDELTYDRGLCPTCEQLEEEQVILTPLIHPPLTEAFIDRFIEAFRRAVGHAEELSALRKPGR